MLNAVNWTARLNELATEANVPGAALGIWSDGQEILAAHGVLNSATQVPVTTDSVFQVGSITKIWTATMIMQLVDEGLLSLDTTVSEVLPGARLGTARCRRPGDGAAPAHPHQRDRRGHIHRHRPGRRLRRALRRPAGRGPVGVHAGRDVLLLQQRLRAARPDHRGPRRPVLGRIAARAADRSARPPPRPSPCRRRRSCAARRSATTAAAPRCTSGACRAASGRPG